jgi:hypothetical protein
MATRTVITRAVPPATPSPFSIKGFNEILACMGEVIAAEQAVDDLRNGKHLNFAIAQEAAVEAWVKTELAVQAFARSHAGRTVVPLLVDAVHDLAGLLDLEFFDRTNLAASTNAAVKRQFRATKGSDVRNLLKRAVPLTFQIASLQASFFGGEILQPAA